MCSWSNNFVYWWKFWSLYQLIMEGKFHLSSRHFSPSFRIKQPASSPNVSFLPLASMPFGMHDAPPKAKLMHAICPVPLDLVVLTLSVHQSVQGQSRHCRHFLSIFPAPFWWWWGCSAALKEQPLTTPRAIFFYWYRQQIRPLR